MTVTKSNRDIKSLQPMAQKAAQLFLNECKKQGVDIFVTEYHRSQERQDYLYAQGRTRSGNKVTWTRNSNHTSGYAWDIAVSPPNNLYDSKMIAKAGAIAKALNIEWGGTWKQKDNPHFQISKDWREPMEDKKIPTWQENSIKEVCGKYSLDTEQWLGKATENITVGEMFAILNKIKTRV